MKKRYLFVFILFAFLINPLWSFAYDGSGQVSTYPGSGGSDTSGGGGPNMTDLENAQDELEEDMEELLEEIDDLDEGELSNTEAESAIAEDNNFSESDLSVETNIDSVIEENQETVAAAETAAQAETTGDPVIAATGEFIHTDTDFTLNRNFTLERTYRLHNKITGIFGEGWSSTLDERLLFCREPGIEELYNRQLAQYKTIKSITSRMADALYNDYHISNIDKAVEEINEKYRQALELKAQAEKNISSAESLFGTKSQQYIDAQNTYTRISNLVNTYKTATEKVPVYYSRYVKLRDRKNAQETLNKKLKSILNEDQKIDNTYTFYNRTPEAWLYSGIGNLVFIDGNSSPHTFIKNDNDWKTKSDTDRTFEKIIKSENGDFLLYLKNGFIKHFDNYGLLKKIENPEGDFLLIERNQSHLVSSVKTSFNEELSVSWIYNYNGENSAMLISEISNRRDPTNKISFSYESRFLSSVTDSENDTVSFSYSSGLSEITKCDGSSIKIKNQYVHRKGNICAVQTTNEEGASEFFTYEKNKTIYTDHEGNETVFYFNENLQTERKTDPAGNDIKYQYDLYGNIIRQDTNGFITSYTYDEKNNLTETFFPDGTSEKYFYDERSNLISTIDRDGYTHDAANSDKNVSYTYDNYGNIKTAVSPSHKIDMTYDSRNRITSLALDGKNQFSISYGERSSTTEYYTGLKITKTYNNRNDLIEEKEEDPSEKRTVVFHYEYNKIHLPVKKTIIENEVERTLWKKEWNSESQILLLKEYDPWDCWVTEYEYSKEKLCRETSWKESEPEKKSSFQVSEEVNSRNKISQTVTDRRGNSSLYEFSENGFLERYTSEEGEIFNFTFSPAGRILKATGEYGKEFSYEYDSSGNLIEEKTESSNNEYFPDTYEYDSYGRIIKITDPEGNSQGCHYNSLGLIDKVFDGYGNTTEISYNAKNLVAEKLFPDGTKICYKYDANQNLTEISDSAGTSWKGEYDGEGNLIHEEGRNTVEKSYCYDKTGRVTSVIADGILLEGYEYSDYGRNTIFTDGENQKFYFYRNEDGTLISETNRLNETKTYSTNEADSDDSQIVWDDSGKILKAWNDSSSFEFAYFENGLLESFTDIPSMETVRYQYDRNGNKTRVTSSNRDISYVYGKNNEILEIKDNLSKLSVNIFYDNMQREIRREYGNRTSLDFCYDKAGRMISVIEKDLAGNVINGEGYLYGEDGRRSATVDINGNITAYRYNKLGQIISVHYPADTEHFNHLKKEAVSAGLTPEESIFSSKEYFIPSDEYEKLLVLFENKITGFSLPQTQNVYEESFAYDKNGNRTERTLPFGTFLYTYDAENRLTEICFQENSIVKYDYDANGNLTSRISQSSNEKYSYSAGNRLTDYVKSQNGTVTTCHYTYDVFGRRQLTVRNGKAALRCLYDGFSFDLIKESPVFQNGLFTDYLKNSFYMTEERESDERYIFTTSAEEDYFCFEESFPLSLNGKVYGTKTGNQTEYFGSEILGSINSITDHFGNLKKTFSYDIFGTTISEETPSCGYAGKPYDSVTGFYNYGFRDYSPALSRFTSPDPIRYGTNWYQYCDADPVNFIDLWGLKKLNLPGVPTDAKKMLEKKYDRDHTEVQVYRHSEDIVGNDVMVIVTDGQITKMYNCQSEKNMLSTGQVAGDEHKNNYETRDFTLPCSEDYKITLVAKTGNFINPLQITNRNVIVDGQSITSSDGFLIHGLATIKKPDNPFVKSLGCQMLTTNEDFSDFRETLEKMGFENGDSLTLKIRKFD